MTTQQPTWKFAGRTGDVDPIAYGGGFIYEDETGVYAPEMVFFDPAPDEVWKRYGGETKVTIYRFIVERNPEREWWWDRLQEVADAVGVDLEALRSVARDESTMERARVYGELLACYGPHEFDQYPTTLTEDEAYAKYALEMKGGK